MTIQTKFTNRMIQLFNLKYSIDNIETTLYKEYKSCFDINEIGRQVNNYNIYFR